MYGHEQRETRCYWCSAPFPRPFSAPMAAPGVSVIKTYSQTQGFACASCAAEPPAVSEGPFLRPPKDLLACGKCRRVKYCGGPCQRQDFPGHKRVCGALVALSAVEAEMGREHGPGPMCVAACVRMRGIVVLYAPFMCFALFILRVNV